MKFQEYLITEDAATSFLETCACIGIVIDNSTMSDIKKFLTSPTSDDFEDVYAKSKELLDKIINITKGSYDWDNAGVKTIAGIDLYSDKGMEKFNELLSLIKGMNNFISDVANKALGSNLYFVHSKITTYYSIEQKLLGPIKGAKDNTADCIIMNVPASTFLSKLTTEPLDSNGENSYIKLGDDIRFIQVSLKKSDGGAQLGKITKMLTAFKFNKGVKSAKDDLIKENVTKVLGLSDERLDEGFLELFSRTAGKLWDKLKNFVNKTLSKFSSKYMSIFKSSPDKKHIDDLFKGINLSEGFVDRCMDVLNEKEISVSTLKDLEILENNRTVIYQRVNQSLRDLETTIGANEMIYQQIEYIKGVPEWKDAKKDIFTLVSNYLTIKTLQAMVMDSRGLNEILKNLVAEMFFGGTKLPLWKVFGDFGKGKSYQYLGTIDAFISKYPGQLSIEPMGVRVNTLGTYYSISIVMLEKVDDKGKYYILLRTGTNSSSSFTFVFEGTGIKGPYNLEYPIAKIVSPRG